MSKAKHPDDIHFLQEFYNISENEHAQRYQIMIILSTEYGLYKAVKQPNDDDITAVWTNVLIVNEQGNANFDGQQ